MALRRRKSSRRKTSAYRRRQDTCSSDSSSDGEPDEKCSHVDSDGVPMMNQGPGDSLTAALHLLASPQRRRRESHQRSRDNDVKPKHDFPEVIMIHGEERILSDDGSLKLSTLEPMVPTDAESDSSEDDASDSGTSGCHRQSNLPLQMTATAPSKTAKKLFSPEPSQTPTNAKETIGSENREEKDKKGCMTFSHFRMLYLIVHTAIMLADGLQGTHLYVLYEGYGYSVASLYSLGFISGAFTSPFIGPLVDRIGRKKAAMLYCMLEIGINLLEQYPLFVGLIASRVVGGITTNLLFSVFESWLVTEHRKQGFDEDKLEIILRDTTIVSNSAAIISGYMAHYLASMLGPVGPFEGAVTCTWVALVMVGLLWSENYGSESSESTTFRDHMIGAFRTIVDDSKISRIGLIQGLSEGSLQTFVFLWSPALRSFASSAHEGTFGLDVDGEPAYGLIFGAFMACGVVGGFAEPTVRQLVNWASSLRSGKNESNADKAASVDLLCALCYFTSALLLSVPRLMGTDNPYSFTVVLGAFLVYELMVGMYMPCEGVIRSIYMPNESICSLMTMLRVIVNVAVALGVISTNYVSFTSAFSALSLMMTSAGLLQLSLMPKRQLLNLCGISC